MRCRTTWKTKAQLSIVSLWIMTGMAFGQIALTTTPSVARNSDGRLEMFARGSDGAAWHNWQVASGGGWSGWQSLGGLIVGTPSVALDADGKLEIFDLGTDGRTPFYNVQTSPGGGWSGWQSLGGLIIGVPSVALDANGRLEIFGIGTDGQTPFYNVQTSPGGGWSGWQSMGGLIVGTPSVALDADRKLEIFGLGTDGRTPFYNVQTSPGGGWSGWQSLGGALSATPSAFPKADGRVQLFAINGPGYIYTNSQSAVGSSIWHGWHPVFGFKILIDTNQMDRSEALGAVQLAADGVWSLPQNSCPNCNIPDPIYDPNNIWPQALAKLNAAAWSVAEDGFNDWVDYPNGNAYQLTSAYLQTLGLALQTSFVYHECSPNQPCNYGYGTDTTTVLSTGEIGASAQALGTSIIVLSRTYDNGTTEQNLVGQALQDPNCSGVAFEQSPDYAHISAHNYNQGINDALNAGRKMYILLPPYNDNAYAADVVDAIEYLSESGQLVNPNLYIVLAAYGRGTGGPQPPNGVGFLSPDNSIAGNSILAALAALKSYRGD